MNEVKIGEPNILIIDNLKPCLRYIKNIEFMFSGKAFIGRLDSRLISKPTLDKRQENPLVKSNEFNRFELINHPNKLTFEEMQNINKFVKKDY